MGFMDAYKRLEKLCRDTLKDDRGVSAYLEEMANTSRGSSAVDTWNTDLKKLKHYRWVRNQIAHNPDCTEENMCSAADEKWLKDFYKRVLNQTDPLSLYRKTTRKKRLAAKKRTASSQPYAENRTFASVRQKKPKKRGVLLVSGLLFVLFMLVLAQMFW